MSVADWGIGVRLGFGVIQLMVIDKAADNCDAYRDCWRGDDTP